LIKPLNFLLSGNDFPDNGIDLKKDDEIDEDQ